MAKKEKTKEPDELRGQLMLQIAAGRFFGLALRSTNTLTGAPSTATRG
jgi:hypothetical protein